MYQHSVISSDIPMRARMSVMSGCGLACTLRSASGVVMGARNSRAMASTVLVSFLKRASFVCAGDLAVVDQLAV